MEFVIAKIKDFLSLKNLKKFIFNNPIMVLGFVLGICIGSFVSKLISWIPILGGILGSFITIGFGIVGMIYLPKLKDKE